MDTIEDKILDDLLSPGRDVEMDPAHRAWMNQTIKDRLTRMEAGQATFKTLQEVRRKFGFDAY